MHFLFYDSLKIIWFVSGFFSSYFTSITKDLTGDRKGFWGKIPKRRDPEGSQIKQPFCELAVPFFIIDLISKPFWFIVRNEREREREHFVKNLVGIGTFCLSLSNPAIISPFPFPNICSGNILTYFLLSPSLYAVIKNVYVLQF